MIWLRTNLQYLGKNSAHLFVIFALLSGFIPADFAPHLAQYLPAILSLILASAVMRMDVRLARARLQHYSWLAGVIISVVFIMVIMPLMLFALAETSGLDERWRTAIVIFATSPPIISSVMLITLLRLDTIFALMVVIGCSLLAPLIGPLLLSQLLGATLRIDVMAAIWQLAAIFVSGFILGYIFRKIMDRAAIAPDALELDGLSTLILILFAFGVFAGLYEQIWDRPMLALGYFAIGCVLAFGSQILIIAIAKWGGVKFPTLTPTLAIGSLGLMNGNRAVVFYVAVMPFDADLALFVAIFQFPIYGCMAVLGRAYRSLHAHN